MFYYIADDNGKILLYDNTSKERFQQTITYTRRDLWQYEIKETETEIDTIEGEYYFVDDPVYIQKKKEEKAALIGNLHLTRGDVFEALILAKQKSKADLRTMIETLPGITDIERALYLNRFDEALEFYRRHPAIDLIGQLLGIQSEQMDNFFIKATNREENAWQALIAPVTTEPEQPNEESSVEE